MSNKSQREIWNSLYKNSFTWHFESKLHSLCKNKVILEIGVGIGKTLQAILKQHPKHVSAIDFSEESISLCKLKFKDRKISFRQADLLSLPFPSRCFDIVVCYFVLNNLKIGERKRAIKEISRVLRPNGIVLFKDLGNKDYRKFSFKKEISKSGRFSHFFNLKEIKSLFGGFKIKKLKISRSNPIKKEPSLKRHLISAVFQKQFY